MAVSSSRGNALDRDLDEEFLVACVFIHTEQQSQIIRRNCADPNKKLTKKVLKFRKNFSRCTCSMRFYYKLSAGADRNTSFPPHTMFANIFVVNSSLSVTHLIGHIALGFVFEFRRYREDLEHEINELIPPAVKKKKELLQSSTSQFESGSKP